MKEIFNSLTRPQASLLAITRITRVCMHNDSTQLHGEFSLSFIFAIVQWYLDKVDYLK